MKQSSAVMFLLIAASSLPLFSAEAPPPRPKAGKPEIMHESEVKPGMKGWAWTVLQGTDPEPIPIEVVGISKNMWGPKQDIILAKMLGKALRTNVARGMSGSPVYIEGKLVGAVSLGLSQFSPDSICGITPIDLMLDIDAADQTRPAGAKVPDSGQRAAVSPAGFEALAPIDSPVVFSGFSPAALNDFSSTFQQMGVRMVQGTGGTSTVSAKPVAGWEKALNPGESVATVLIDGDMGMSAFGTVTYNDGKKVLAFGHPLFNLGPVSMPLAKSEVVLTLASQFQPTKIANATGVVGALRQDRHSGILGELGATAPMIPVTLRIRSLDSREAVRGEKDFHFSVFVHQKWTPTLMMLTLYNSISNMNELVDEATYRLSGKVEMNGVPRPVSLATMQAAGDVPMPAPMALALWLGDKFNKLYLNNVNMPDVKSVAMTLDLVPERRIAAIDSAWVPNAEVQPGEDVPVKVSLRPYRGEPIQREITVHIPEGIARGDHRILLSDADTLNRMQNAAGFANRFIDLSQTVSLLNQERTNNRLYVALVESSPTAYYDDKTMPSLPASVLNVMQAGRASNRNLITTPETAVEQASLAFDYMVTGSYSVRIHVK
ncbi:MAG TPA: hypothetical protein VMH28_13905 [Candidatus Acidoferrales bacterium]|nr:hypothetical protein [Candidatus Acidoferrales bacterium]